MVFSSLEFLYVFLPITVIFYSIMTLKQYLRTRIVFIILASLVYYAYWNIPNTLIIIASTILNYLGGQWIASVMTPSKSSYI